MGVMQKLRQSMPVVIVIVAIVFIALIIFEWGDASQGRGTVNPRAQIIGEVNGEEISIMEYESRVNDVLEMQRQSNPNAEVDDERIRQEVWDQLVNEVLIQQAADRMGLIVSDEQLRDVLLYDPPQYLKQEFTDSTGRFMQDIYLEFINDIPGFFKRRGLPDNEVADMNERFLKAQEQIRKDLTRQAVESVVTATAIPSESAIRASFEEQRTKASGSYAVLPVTLIPDSSVQVTEDEARKYYDAHKGDYFQKASREARYVLFPLAASAQDSNKVRSRLKTVMDQIGATSVPAAKDTLFASFVEQYGSGNYSGVSYTPLQEVSPELQNALQGAKPGDIVGPVRLQDGTYLVNVADVKDSGEVYVKALHILLKTTPGGNEDSVKAQADKLVARLKAGDAFEPIATEYSQDFSSAQRGGDMGYFKRGMMVKAFEDAAFSAAPNTIVGPFKTEYGYHIIKVTDKTAKSYKLRDLRFDIRTSNTTRNLLRRRAQDFRAALEQGGQSIDTLAAKQGLQVYESGPIQRGQPTAGSTKLTNFAFEGNVGDISDALELPDGSMVIGQISKVRDAGSMSFEDAKDQIMEKLRTQKKLALLKPRAEKVRAALAAGDSLGKLKSIDQGVDVQSFTDVTRSTPFPGVGFDYGLSAAAFTAQPEQISQPIRGERGYYIVRVSNRTQPTDKEFAAEKEAFTKQLISTRKSSMFQEWLTKAREHAQIEDLRTNVH